MTTLKLTFIRKDEYRRSLYKGTDNSIYVDVDGEIHTITEQGEPNYPIHNYEIMPDFWHLLKQCQSSLRNLSHNPEDRGKREIEGWNASIIKDFAAIELSAKDQDCTEAKKRYYTKTAQLLSAYFGSRANTASTFITGGSNFPVRQQEKRHAWADNKYKFLLEWQTRALNAIAKGFQPKKDKSIEAELTRYRAELDERKERQEKSKAVNAMLRKTKDNSQRLVILQEMGMSAIEAAQMMQPDYLGRVAVPACNLTNNIAAIKRVEGMIKQLEQRAALAVNPPKEFDVAGVRVLSNFTDNRLQAFFPDKPDYNTRDQLKKNGFRWSPTNECWQSYLNQNQFDKLRRILKVI